MATRKANSAAPAASSKARTRTSPTSKLSLDSNPKTTQGTATALYPSTSVRCLLLNEEDRKDSRFVIRSGKSYLSKVEAGELTTLLADAIAHKSHWDAKAEADRFGKTGSRVPLVVEQLVVERNGVVTGSEPAFGYDCELGLAFYPGIHKWGGTRHNSVLAECAEVEERRAEIISGHMDALMASRMYKLFVSDYRADLAKPEGNEPDWYLSLFATYIFYAGVIAGRRENGRRNDYGELILDAPRSGLRHDSVLAECLEAEDDPINGDLISDHLTMLSCSPMFRLLVEGYHADLGRPECLEADWYLAQFAARVFYAGVLAGRRENGQRAVTGHLIMDDPCSYEPKDAIITPGLETLFCSINCAKPSGLLNEDRTALPLSPYPLDICRDF